MDSAEATALIMTALAKYREWSWLDLGALIDESIHFEVVGASGTQYQIEIWAVWDWDPQGNIRVFGSIDDGGWRAFAPLTKAFIKAPDGKFVGEDPE